LVRRHDAGPALAVTDAGVGAARRRRTVAALASAPREVAVAHHDPARDYQIGVQRVRRPGAGERIDRVELPAVLDAASAKAVAGALVARGEAERTRRRVTLGVEGLGVAPGEIVTVAGETGRWRVASSSTVGLATTLELVPLAAVPIAGAASSGQVSGAPDLTAGRTLLVAAELPALGEGPLAAPRICVLAAGEGAGWRQAALLYSLDDGASWTAAGGTAAPAAIGRIEVAPDVASAWLVDRRSRVVVAMARPDMMPGDADAAALAQGTNLALLGDELVQFARAEPLGNGRWALTDLRRGLRGTEAAIGTQRPGDRFALIEADAVATIELPVAAIGRPLRILASGTGDDAAPVEVSLMVTGASVAPPAPVHGTVVAQPDGGLAIGWVRRSRAGWSWGDGADVPLAEEAERYRVTLTADAGARTFDVTGPQLALSAAERPHGMATVRIVQQGTLAPSPAAEFTFDAGG
jgi:hypothetical protein